jgi:hypothetical protein
MWARVPTHRAGVARGLAAPPWRVGPPWLLSTPPSGFVSLLGKYNFLVFFWNFPDLQNMVPSWSFFQQNPDSGSNSSDDHQTCGIKGNNISMNSKYEIYQ